VTTNAVKMKNYFKKKKRSSRRIFFQKYFAQKIENKTLKTSPFFCKVEC